MSDTCLACERPAGRYLSGLCRKHFAEWESSSTVAGRPTRLIVAMGEVRWTLPDGAVLGQGLTLW